MANSEGQTLKETGTKSNVQEKGIGVGKVLKSGQMRNVCVCRGVGMEGAGNETHNCLSTIGRVVMGKRRCIPHSLRG